jgi:hypothetical protein
MKINLRHEIAMWVLGLLWTGFAFMLGAERQGFGKGEMLAVFALLVPSSLIIFSLRDRRK